MLKLEDLEKIEKLIKGKETSVSLKLKESDFNDLIDIMFGGEEDADVKTCKKPIR